MTGDFPVDRLTDNLLSEHWPKATCLCSYMQTVSLFTMFEFAAVRCLVLCGIGETDICGCCLHLGRFGLNSDYISLVMMEFDLL